jgi:cytochrome c oxidase subunit 4
MSAEHHEHVRKHIRIYLWVFAALTVGTIITVAVANVHFGILLGIAVAVVIATIKGSLVAGYFMHLFSEKKLIYAVLALTFPLVVVMVGLILATHADQQGGQHGIFNVPQRHVQPHATGSGHQATHPEPEKPHTAEVEVASEQPELSEAVSPTQPEPAQTQTNQPEAVNVP